jgi:hypothetical protein
MKRTRHRGRGRLCPRAIHERAQSRNFRRPIQIRNGTSLVALAALNTADLLPVLQFRFGAYSTSNLLTNASELLLAISMATMGLEVNIVLE